MPTQIFRFQMPKTRDNLGGDYSRIWPAVENGASKVGHPQPTSGGFTLIEILIAISIFVVMGAIAYQSLTNIARTKQSLDAARQEHMLAATVLNRLTRELRLAYAQGRPLLASPGEPARETGRNIYFRVEPTQGNQGYHSDRVTFLALNAAQYFPDGRNRSGVVQISYYLSADPSQDNALATLDGVAGDGNLALVREEMPALNSDEEAQRLLVRFPIARRIRGLQVSSYSNRSKQWVATWGGDTIRERIPAMIQITIVIRSISGEDHSYTTTVALSGGGR